MLAFASSRSRRPPTLTPKSPTLLPKKRPARQVFLEPEMWERLSEAADFHSLVFEKMREKSGVAERVSRNDLIESFLQWALDAYWDDKGGKPSTPEEQEQKAVEHAKKLSAMQNAMDAAEKKRTASKK